MLYVQKGFIKDGRPASFKPTELTADQLIERAMGKSYYLVLDRSGWITIRCGLYNFINQETWAPVE